GRETKTGPPCAIPARARGAQHPGAGEGKMLFIGTRLIAGLLLTLTFAVVAHAEPPKRVLLLHSWGPEFGDLYAKDMRVQLGRQLSGRFELYEEWLVSARFTDRQEDAAFPS